MYNCRNFIICLPLGPWSYLIWFRKVYIAATEKNFQQPRTVMHISQLATGVYFRGGTFSSAPPTFGLFEKCPLHFGFGVHPHFNGTPLCPQKVGGGTRFFQWGGGTFSEYLDFPTDQKCLSPMEAFFSKGEGSEGGGGGGALKIPPLKLKIFG